MELTDLWLAPLIQVLLVGVNASFLLDDRCPECGELLCGSHGDRDELDSVLPDPTSSETQGSLHHLASHRPEVLFQIHDHSR